MFPGVFSAQNGRWLLGAQKRQWFLVFFVHRRGDSYCPAELMSNGVFSAWQN